MAKIYWIGGSPCSGKSTIAEIISNRYGLYYFKVDDYLEKYANYGFLLNLEICRKQSIMNPEEI
ncbi:MAG: shikimate kinase [Paenibacillaceae bacterium]|jgi:adenylate kinase family enzyme|nr:shikimate kinase [Paenibacillaceae bacterium]